MTMYVPICEYVIADSRLIMVNANVRADVAKGKQDA